MTKVSIVLPTYNRATALRHAIRDILSQTHRDFELIVMDDDSKDETARVVKEFADERVRYHNVGHHGIPGIVIQGFGLCTAPYLMVLHDHDTYDPTLIAELAAALDAHPRASFAHCGVHILDSATGGVKATYVPDYPPLYDGREFLARELLPGLASPVTALTMVRRSACEGSYLDPRFGACSDVELWMRLSTRGDVAFVAKPLMGLRQRDSSSHFFYNAQRLLNWVVQAKKEYLPLIQDEAARAQIAKRWRREIDITGLGYVLTALEHGRPQDLPDIEAFVAREGSPAGLRRVRLAARAPRGPALAGLRFARWARRKVRAARGIHGA